MVKTLLSHGALPYLTNKENISATDFAYDNEMVDLGNLLFEKECALGLELQHAAETNDLHLIQSIYHHDFAVKFRGDKMQTLLHLAAKSHSIDVVEFLLQRDFPVGVPDSEGKTARMIVEDKDNLDENIAYLLLLKEQELVNNIFDTPNSLFDESESLFDLDEDIQDAVDEIAKYPMGYNQVDTLIRDEFVKYLQKYQNSKSLSDLETGRSIMRDFIENFDIPNTNRSLYRKLTMLQNLIEKKIQNSNDEISPFSRKREKGWG